jgi:hypothetical protein
MPAIFRMVQRGENLGFTMKSADAIGILRELFRQDPDRPKRTRFANDSSEQRAVNAWIS